MGSVIKDRSECRGSVSITNPKSIRNSMLQPTERLRFSVPLKIESSTTRGHVVLVTD